MRKIRFVTLAVLGIIGIALPLYAQQVFYFTDVFYMDASSNIVGEWVQNCNGSVYSWGQQTENMSVMQGQCNLEAVCEDPYFWAYIDGGGPFCVDDVILDACCR